MKGKRAGDLPLTGIFRRVTCHLPGQLSGESTGNRRHPRSTAHLRRPFRHDVKTRSEAATGTAERGRNQRPASRQPRKCTTFWLWSRPPRTCCAHRREAERRTGGPTSLTQSKCVRKAPTRARVIIRHVWPRSLRPALGWARTWKSSRHIPPSRASNAARGELCKRPYCVTEARSSPSLHASSARAGMGCTIHQRSGSRGNTAMQPQDQEPVKKDALGVVYDTSYTDSRGETHYTRDHAQGTAQGPAHWSTEHDCNPICGCHLSAKCRYCGVCMTCDGCYCLDMADY